MSSPPFENLGDHPLQRMSKRILARCFFESLIGASTGALVGMLAKTLHRGLGHAVLTGASPLEGFHTVGVMEHAREGLLVGWIAGAVISIGYGLAAALVRTFRHRHVPISGRMVGMISGTLVTLILALERQVAMSFSGGMSTLEWRIVNTPVDLALLCLSGAIAGAAWGAWVSRWAEPIPARQE